MASERRHVRQIQKHRGRAICLVCALICVFVGACMLAKACVYVDVHLGLCAQGRYQICKQQRQT